MEKFEKLSVFLLENNISKKDLLNYIESYSKEDNAPIDIVSDEPKEIGTLTKPFGIKGYQIAEIGHQVFEKSDRFLIKLKSNTGGDDNIVPFYKDTLKPFINFYE